MLRKADLDEFERLRATTVVDCSDVADLQTLPEVLAYSVQVSRAQGSDEADMVELLARTIPLSPDEVRGAERILRQLGYRTASDRLRWLAGKRKRDLRPLPDDKTGDAPDPTG